MTFNYACLFTVAMSLIRITILIIGGYFLIGIVVSKIRQKFIYGRHDALIPEFISHVISYLLFFAVVLAIFHEIGINITAFLGMAGIVGIAVGYAAQSSISNMISGIFVMFERPFNIGDQVIINGIQGHIVDVNLFSITLRNACNVLIRIPHEEYRKNTISNLTALPLRRHDFCIEVQNVSSLLELQRLIQQVVDATRCRVSDKKSYVEVIQLYAYTTTFAIGIWVTQAQLPLLKGDIVAELKEALEKEGVVVSAFYLGHEKK